MWQYQNADELYHYGILGMKWGIRRYQNKDGSLTPAGKKKYSKEIVKTFKKNKKSTLQTLRGKKSYSFGKNTEKVKKNIEKKH